MAIAGLLTVKSRKLLHALRLDGLKILFYARYLATNYVRLATTTKYRLPQLTGTIAATFVVAAATFLSGCNRDSEDPALAARLPSTVDYNFDVKPIISDRCYACHGPDENKRKAELRLDHEDEARPQLRQLVKRITSEDPDEVMPPPESNLKLSEYEKAVLVRWVKQGAEFKPHWAFSAPTQPDPPIVADSLRALVRNPIDRFVLQRLQRELLSPKPRAPRETLIRRLSFDLTGLPPTPDEVDAFVRDERPDAYERLVDRLLASPAYGENMAAEWLDVARYADSHGYQDDGLRNMWPWRDWVIGAFNDNMRYDEFVKAQLAGDLLPNRTRDQLLATGFNRNHLQSQEGGIVPEEYRVDYVADRTNTLGRAFLGLTVSCAQCHDHKYDPISQKEYFRLFAFFNSVNEFGNIAYAGEASPTVILPEPDAEQALVQLARQIDSLEVLAAPTHQRYDGPFQRWIDSFSGVSDGELARGRIAHYPFEDATDRKIINTANRSKDAYTWGDVEKEVIPVAGQVGGALKLVGDPWIDMGKDVAWFERNEAFSIGLWFNIPNDALEGPLFSKSGGLFNGLRGYVAMLKPDGTLEVSLNHVFPANSIAVQTTAPLPKREWSHLVLTYDGSSRADGIRLFLNGGQIETLTLADNLKMSILYQVDPRTRERSNWGDPGNLRVGWIEPNMIKLDSVEVDELMVYDRQLSRLEVHELSGLPTQTGEPDHDDAREHYVLTHDPVYQETLRELTRLRGEENELLTAQPEVMVLEELAEPRPTYVLERGAYDAPGEEVTPGAPAALLRFDDALPPDRRGLAEWLLDPQHPLTARVAVNRMWQRFFGRGIVATPDDFGAQGARPSHPDLLDWLATRFIENGWNVKALQKEIVSSATYRQSSLGSDVDLDRDPDNILLARGPSFRLTAEQIRDNALAASGLLNREIGGEPVKPYQPPGLWGELATRNATKYEQDTGEKLYRRSMYTIWKRTTPPPSLISFDAAERNMCTVKRQSTNTPLQALVLMNDPQFVEAARVLAERIMLTSQDREARLNLLFATLTSRRADDTEIALLSDLYAGQHQRFAADRTSADQLLSVGEKPRNGALGLAELASYAVVANTLMSYDEVVMRR